MHKLLGEWDGSNECHVANAGDWLVIWKTVDGIAYFQHTGSHDDPVCKKLKNATKHAIASGNRRRLKYAIKCI